MSGRSRTDGLVQAWAERSAAAAGDGDVCEENLCALLAAEYDSDRAWLHAVDAYSVVLATLSRFEGSLKLIVRLTPRPYLDIEGPAADVESEIDTATEPAPSLVIHALAPRRYWEPFEVYRRPLDASVFPYGDRVATAQAVYTTFRDLYDLADGSEYRRQIVFERIQPVPNVRR